MSGLSPTMCPGDLTQSDSSGTLIGRTKLFFLMKFDLFVPEMSSEQQQKRLSCLREQLNIGHSDISFIYLIESSYEWHSLMKFFIEDTVFSFTSNKGRIAS